MYHQGFIMMTLSCHQVNLVKARLEEMAEKGRSQRVDMVTSVLPRVALDMVSYSAYDAGLASDAAYGGFWEVRGDEDENDDDDEFDDDDGGDDDDEYDDDDDDDDDDAVRRCGS
jgi:predicted transcriptional regulator